MTMTMTDPLNKDLQQGQMPVPADNSDGVMTPKGLMKIFTLELRRKIHMAEEGQEHNGLPMRTGSQIALEIYFLRSMTFKGEPQVSAFC